MREKKNAPPAATGKRAVVTSDSSTAHNSSLLAVQVTAEIFVADHPTKKRQIDKDRPIDIVPVKAGGCVAGHTIPGEQPVRRHRRLRYNRKNHRRGEIEKVFHHLFPVEHGIIPNRAEARAFAVVIADHVTRADAFAWIARNLSCELPRIEAENIVKSASGREWGADDLACMLGVTKAIRDELGLRTIGASDFSKRQRTAERKRKDRDRKRVKRAAQNCGKVRAIPASKAQPWREIGMSRSQWFEQGLNKVYKRDVAEWTRRVRNTLLKDNADTKSPSVATLVLHALAEPMRVTDLVELLGLTHRNIRPILSRLRAEGKAAPIARGVWEATALDAGGHKAAARTEPDKVKTATERNARSGGTLSSRDVTAVTGRSSSDRRAHTTATASIDHVATTLRGFIAALESRGLAGIGHYRAFNATQLENRDAQRSSE